MEDLDRRAEAVERAALSSLHDLCPPEAKRRLGLHSISVADVLVSVAEYDPSILLNRAVGLATTKTPSLATIETIAGIYREHGVRRFFLHVHPDELPAHGIRWLGEAGLEKARSWRQFHRIAAPPADVSTDLRIEPIGYEYATDFAKIVCAAFDMTPAAEPLIAAAAHDDRWRLFMSFDGDKPAGAGGLFVHDDCGWLDFGATSPEFRRRGSQGAIMAARIQAALDAGCEHLFTETGEAVEGDPQHSYGNIERHGFEPAALRENWTFAQ
ncbi:MAG: GNAT family N-acetyltransferase [Gammaproteobacteria bacterium]